MSQARELSTENSISILTRKWTAITVGTPGTTSSSRATSAPSVPREGAAVETPAFNSWLSKKMQWMVPRWVSGHDREKLNNNRKKSYRCMYETVAMQKNVSMLCICFHKY